jgi:hypothetical protein
MVTQVPKANTKVTKHYVYLDTGTNVFALQYYE